MIAFIATLSLICNVANEPVRLPVDNPSSVPEQLRVVDGRLFFTADDGVHGRELWTWEPSGAAEENGAFADEAIAGGIARLVADLMPGRASSGVEHLRDCAGVLYFLAETPASGREVCFWDSQADAVRVIDVCPGAKGSDPAPVCYAGPSGVLFWADDGTNGRQLHATQPGTLATIRLTDLTGVDPRRGIFSESTKDGLYIFFTSYTLGRSEGTRETTGLYYKGLSEQTNIRFWPLGNRMLLLCGTTETGKELWTTDGSDAGTLMLRDIMPGPDSSDPDEGCPVGTNLYYKACSPEYGIELWKTDGTNAGTVMVKDIYPGPASGNPHYFHGVGDVVYFLADDGIHGTEPWKSDGTEAGTVLVCDLYQGVSSSSPWSPCGFKNRLYFCANSPGYGEEVFSTGDTPGTATLLRDIVPGTGSSGPDNLTQYGNFLFFTCDNKQNGEELWMSDGTESGTRLAADIAPILMNPSSSPQSLTDAQGRLFFTLPDIDHGRELWISDGTEPGTHIATDMVPGPAGSEPQELCSSSGTLFFTADTPELGRELWAVPSGEENARLVKDLVPGAESGNPRLLTPAGDVILFTAGDTAHGHELWISNGTSDGTRLVKDVSKDSSSGPITEIFSVRGRIYFYVQRGLEAVELWRTDKSEAGTRALFQIDAGHAGWDPAMPDDLPAPGHGLIPLAGGYDEEDSLTPLLHPAGSTANNTQSADLGAVTLFVAHTRRFGTELCRTDGSRTGTGLVCDAFPGIGSSSPTCLTVLGERAYFIADHPREGRVVWRSDGTREGTFMLYPQYTEISYPSITSSYLTACRGQIILTGPWPINGVFGNDMLMCLTPTDTGEKLSSFGTAGASGPFRDITPCGDAFYFLADDGIHGEELWRADMSPNAVPTERVRLVKDILVPGDLSPRH